ncbi:MAG TPA: hypothetical protein VFW39_07970 [Sphingomicrobium sp.]|nr:hypothetical protein [Sphingomicrobium sp.]
MTFWKALKETYGGSIAFLIACPLLALVPFVFEMVQHVIEVHIGLYASAAAAQALQYNPLRMSFGLLKTAALLSAGYWITRFVATRNPKYAAAIDPVALRLFAGYFLLGLALTALQLFVIPQTVAITLVEFVAGEVITSFIVAWGAAAALGNPDVGPIASVKLMGRQLPWTVAFLLVAMLPLMVPHYVFAGVAIVGPRALLWPVLILDSLLVSWLTAVLVASAYVAAKRAADRSRVELGRDLQVDFPAATAAE